MRKLLALAAGLCLAAPVPASADVPAPAPDTLLTAQRERTIAPGLELATWDSYDRGGAQRVGWQRWHLLSADLSRSALRADLLGGTVTGVRSLSDHADAAGAVAGVNGDYFNINETNAAIGPEIGGGTLRKAAATPRTVAAVGTDEVARLVDLALEGTVTIGGRERVLDALNSSVPANGAGAFTPLWGPGRRALAAPGTPVTEVVVRDGRVAEVRSSVSEEPVPEGGLVLVARGAAAQELAAAQPGEAVELRYEPKASAGGPFGFALGSGAVLVRDGTVLPQTDNSDAGRTAIGWRRGGRELLLLAVDGRANFSRGATFQEVADTFGRLGAEDAFMLDGGGSTTMVARIPGDREVSTTNTPSDGGERVVPNGVGLFAAPGSGVLRGFDARPGEARAFPGLTRTFAARGHDENRAPVEAGSVEWRARPSDLGRFDGGVLRARRSGSGEAEVRPASAGDDDDDDDDDDDGPSARGTAELTVLDDLVSMTWDARSLTLAPGDSRRVALTGEDAEGFEATIEPRDLELEYDRAVLEVTEEDGALRVRGRPEADGGASLLTARAAGVEASLPVVVGLRAEPLSGFDEPNTWFASGAQANSVSVETVNGADRPGASPDNKALALRYDWRGRPSTSAAYANAGRNGVAQPITLPPGTQRLALWVKGDGRRHWLRATLRSQGVTNVPFTFAAVVDWEGWRRVEGIIPGGFSEPITLRQVYLVETSSQRKDAGEIAIDALDARVGQTLPDPSTLREDPFVIQQGGVGERRWRFAVVSDTHVTAAAGRDSFAGRQTIAAFRQIAAARPDFVIVSGDGVDTNRPEDFAFYEELIDEHLGDIPVHWVPGNHESGAAANGTLANFRAATGRPERETFDHRGIRFITLNSHLGSLRLSDFGQWLDLRRQLDEAARDRRLDGVVVVDHHPPEDVSGGGASQLSDPLEAGLLRRVLADFRESSGKHAALFSGHAHTMAVNRTDGLLEINAPVVGKTPYGPADRGGFFGWMLVGAEDDPDRLRAGRPDPESLDWLRAEVHPLIDGIELGAPQALAAGESQPVGATGVNSDYGLRFPLRHPATVTWSGDERLAVVRGEWQARAAARFRRTVAVLDLATMRLTGVRPGRVRLEVGAGEQRVGADVEVSESAQDAGRQRAVAGRRVEAGSAAAAAAADVTLACALPAQSGSP